MTTSGSDLALFSTCPDCGLMLKPYAYDGRLGYCAKKSNGCGRLWYRRLDGQWRDCYSRQQANSCRNCQQPVAPMRSVCDDCDHLRGRTSAPYWHTPIGYSNCALCLRLFTWPNPKGRRRRTYCSQCTDLAAQHQAKERRRRESLGIKPRRGPITTSARLQIAYQQNYRCFHCDQLLDLSTTYAERSLHIDHIVPFSLGGTDDLTNLVASCASCNLKRGNKPLPQ